MNCCDGLRRFCLDSLGFVEKIDIQEAQSRIEKESEKWTDADNKQMWSDHSQNFAQYDNELLEETLKKFKRPGLAVDLGCGNSSPTIRLLQKGWKVIAVDNSSGALDNLKKTANEYGSNWLRDGQLTLVCQDIETYQFPKKVRLIMANNSLSFCNPAKIKRVWDEAHKSLEVGGRIIGNFFPKQILPGADFFAQSMMNVWLTDLAVVRALLEEKRYKIEKCDYPQPWYELVKNIEFSGLKR